MKHRQTTRGDQAFSRLGSGYSVLDHRTTPDGSGSLSAHDTASQSRNQRAELAMRSRRWWFRKDCPPKPGHPLSPPGLAQGDVEHIRFARAHGGAIWIVISSAPGLFCLSTIVQADFGKITSVQVPVRLPKVFGRMGGSS
jgi:hypothetical protein